MQNKNLSLFACIIFARCGSDLSDHDNLSVICACAVPGSVLKDPDETPRHSNLLCWEKISYWAIKNYEFRDWFRLEPVRHPGNAVYMRGPLQCIRDLDAALRHSNLPWARKIFSYWQICVRGVFNLQDYDTLSVLCACNISCDISWGLMRHPDIGTCREGKKFVLVNNFVWISQICLAYCRFAYLLANTYVRTGRHRHRHRHRQAKKKGEINEKTRLSWCSWPRFVSLPLNQGLINNFKPQK